MAQEVTKTGTDAVSSAMYQRVGALYASIDRDEGFRDILPVPLTATERRELESYRTGLHAKLRPISMATAEQATARKAIGVMLQSYINARSGDPGGTLDAYVAYLRDQPVWAILAALDDFRHRRVFDLNAEGDKVPFTLDHAPSAARILDQVKKHTNAIEDERGRVVRLLAITRYSPPPVPPEEAERVHKLLRGLADHMSVNVDAARRAEREKIRAEADAARERARRIIDDAKRKRAAHAESANAG